MSLTTFNSGGEDSFDDMDMDMDVRLNYDNPDFMTSEFFDSVLSLENNMEENFLSTLDDDVNLSSDGSSHLDEVFSPKSFNSESSDKNSIVDDSSIIDPYLLSFLETPKVELETPKIELEQPKHAKIIIQNPNNKKVIAKPILTTQARQILKGKQQFLKINQITGKGNSVILPLNMKSIKILKTPNNVATLTLHNKIKQTDNIITSTSNPYPPLILTQEEKRLLAKEGIQLPSHHPLTKNEERELKRIRRKIRNKISAQDSRKRKKEYVDGLEERVKRGSEENKNLLQRVKLLQKQNRTLIAHVNKLQALIKNSTASKATPSTCLMVVLLSALLVSLPNIKLFENKEISTEQEQVAIRRSLLSSPVEESPLNLEEFLIFKDEEKTKFDEDIFDIENSTEADFNKMVEEMEKEYEGLISKNNNSKMGLFGKVFETFKYFIQKEKPELFTNHDYGGSKNAKGFLEPDIDETVPDETEGPPMKKSKFGNDQNAHVILNTVNTQITKDK